MELRFGNPSSCSVFVGQAVNQGLQLDGLTCTRGGRQLFKSLSFSVEPGQLLRVRGANGAGKTSLLRMLCGLLQPTEGRVLWLGQPLASQRDMFGHSLVYLGHAAAFKDELSPLENLLDACALGGHAPGLPEAMAALKGAGLRGHERTPARRLSQGQRRRSALARLALCRSAPLWILDEPFNALDTAANTWLTGLIEAHLHNAGMVVLTSHQDMPISTPSQKDLAL
ncbi:MAG: cytochrome c biogenesis heme-transporting ATPase CcmA [Polaromonas sp.]|nr:cytochrome c biogenesis heme-transporting ATPase CcmA [Polaromonas sp.]